MPVDELINGKTPKSHRNRVPEHWNTEAARPSRALFPLFPGILAHAAQISHHQSIPSAKSLRASPAFRTFAEAAAFSVLPAPRSSAPFPGLRSRLPADHRPSRRPPLPSRRSAFRPPICAAPLVPCASPCVRRPQHHETVDPQGTARTTCCPARRPMVLGKRRRSR